PDCFGGPVVTNSCAFSSCTRGCGCAKHPASLRPLCSGGYVVNTSGAPHREIVDLYSGLFDIRIEKPSPRGRGANGDRPGHRTSLPTRPVRGSPDASSPE